MTRLGMKNCNIKREAAKISAVFSGEIGKYEYLKVKKCYLLLNDK